MMVGIGVFVLTAVNIYLYHKIFHIVYFDLGKGLLKEIIGAFLAAILEIAIIQAIGLKFLGWIPKLLGGILKAAAVLVGIIVALGIIGIIYEKVKGKTGEGIKEGSGNRDSSTSGLAEEKNAEGVNTIKKLNGLVQEMKGIQ